MKTVILPSARSDEVQLQCVTYQKVYVGLKNGEPVGVFSRTSYNAGDYVCRALLGFTRGNEYPTTKNPSLKESIRTFIELGNEVVEFDTFVDAADYISEQSSASPS